MSIKDEMDAMRQGLNRAPTVRSTRAASSLSAPGALVGMNAGFANMKREVEELRAAKGQTLRVPLELCDDGDLHAAPVDPSRVRELADNLRENKQSSPAVVRALENGRFEIVMGRHRKYALLSLNATEWDVVVKKFDDDEAEKLSFYDNLFAPHIPDYAIYCGYQRRIERKGYSYSELAEEAGVSKSTISGIMSFGKLPLEALSVIALRPRAVGFNLVRHLLPFCEAHASVVVDVLKKVVDGEISQERAIATASAMVAKNGEVKTQKQPLLAPHEVTMGGKKFASVAFSKKALTVRLADERLIPAVQAAIVKVLEQQAQDALAGKSAT